ncbi:MAG: sulfurtransferase [Xenococcaceae cyanobacterium]
MSQNCTGKDFSLVQTSWLLAHLSDSQLRIFDCTSHLHPAQKNTDLPYQVESGFTDYQRGHIPGAGFLDLQGELSDNSTRLRFMQPSVEQLMVAMSRHGIGEETRVVLYSQERLMWATRVWWMLRALGFDNAAVLDGGLTKWLQEGHPVSTQPCTYPPATFVPRQRLGLFVDKKAVLEAIEEPNVLLINALNQSYYRGDEPSRYGRPGRIPHSVNLYAGFLSNPETQTFVSRDRAKEKLDAIGAPDAERIIIYCGGGISATVILFLMHQLGYENIALYDGSMGEWGADKSLPIERSQKK